MSGLWNFLNSPELVFKVQSFFGIRRDSKDKFKVGNKFFHYLFLLGTELGDELFYGIFIPFFFFNIDCHIGRSFVFHWFINMYFGQALKEFFREERPKKPAIPLQSKWSNEYSLPSTHAMGSASMAAAILYSGSDRYQFNILLGSICVVIWTSIISLSRVYLGMHTVLDLVVGWIISAVLLLTFLPLTDTILNYLATEQISLVIILIVPILLVIIFPRANIWTPTKGDTCCIVSVFTGIEFGFWVNYHFGVLNITGVPDQHSFELGNLYILAARTIVGLKIVALTEFCCKFISLSTLCVILKADKNVLKKSENSLLDTKKNTIDLTSKFFTYSVLGFNSIVIAPYLFKYFNIQRDNFFHEI